ncbi:MAG: hypothetical protein GJ680_15320 [Alteromonadaceae bacterium]|nr:hypothetical protein [Alteromonadaceae bacterium]
MRREHALQKALSPASAINRQKNNVIFATNDLGSNQALNITKIGTVSYSKNCASINIGKNRNRYDFFIRDSADSIKQYLEAIITPDDWLQSSLDRFKS